ncbi:hypothetical protein [Sinorhizobium meliloti]|uniref:hypothetical protein n=1 Tax=Rhizobium meliloti TaxID=382 RepID=UPI003F15DA67
MSDTQRLIECIAGYAETSVMGIDYQFVRDAYGRFVAPVYNLRHRECLLSVVHYRAVPDVPELVPQSVLGLGGQEGEDAGGDERESTPNGEALRGDGPTVEQYVAAGYQAVTYPPSGYASRSTQEEVEAAIAAQSAAVNLADTGTEGAQDANRQPELELDAASAESQTAADADADVAAEQQSAPQQSNRRRR